MSCTLGIIKPDITERNVVGSVLAVLEQNNFQLVEMKMEKMSVARARAFYEVHMEKPFFSSLIDFMTSGSVVAFVARSLSDTKDAVGHYREVIGETNPKQAKPRTIRAMFGTDVERNAIHGSDSAENAKKEILFFFPDFKFD